MTTSSHVIVYTKPGPCYEDCEATKDLLRAYELDFEERDVSYDQKTARMLAGAGYTRFPVVMAFNHTWTGHCADKIRALNHSEARRERRRRDARKRSA